MWEYTPNALIPEGETLPEGVHRIAAAVAYDGSAFCGWQKQSHSPSVQAEVEKALSFVAGESLAVVCAGRTDTGVHATNQIIHFDTRATRTSRSWVLGANANLPDNIRLHWAAPQPARFHARFAASARTYRYIINNTPINSAQFFGQMTWIKAPLDASAMNSATGYLLGEQDYTSFRAAGCQSHSCHRNVLSARVWREGDKVIFEITANAFLLHMVRNIVGALLDVGRGKQPPESIGRLLALRDRTQAPPTASPQGLYLVRVTYPEQYKLPQFSLGPALVSNAPD